MKVNHRAAILCLSLALSCGGSALKAAPTLTTLVSFDGNNGQGPSAGLIADAAGNLYGTTAGGGAFGYGMVFRLTAGTNSLTTLASFDNFNASPESRLIADAAGNLYGTTTNGGDFNGGTVFRVAAGTNTLTTLASFDGSNGFMPRADLMADAAGNLYGMTLYGGAINGGTVFRVAAGTHALTTLASFNGDNGAEPHGGLIADAAGNLYGTTAGGGAFGYGTVFRLTAGTNSLATLASFNGSSNGRHPYAGLMADAAGNLYGTTVGGGAFNFGTVFRVAAGTNAITTLATFDGSNGAYPLSQLIADAAGNLYGTTQGGAFNFGTVFRVAAGTNTITTLATFDGSNGADPHPQLIADAAGNLYGTTWGGGASGWGTVFRLSGAGFVVPEPATSLLAMLAASGFAMQRGRRSSGRWELHQSKAQVRHA